MGVPFIRDARHIYRCSDDAALDARWAAHLAEFGLMPIRDKRTVEAYVNQGRWVADCPECGGGMGVWPERPIGQCLDCGHRYAIKFPSPARRAAAERALLERPREVDRGWRPDRGETPAALAAENTRRLRKGA